ncbi:hypothetical protein PoB_003117900 [Plakobranchus ocellatus]|uniref:Uncharacterized protein n=1 Tax=Plakobranchus ocellatus TaxID=259542 RepID=A0AAV4AE09_9GAST|nr:hypothetical protein PoB_003117900 [Plakobranchus ocellatus]
MDILKTVTFSTVMLVWGSHFSSVIPQGDLRLSGLHQPRCSGGGSNPQQKGSPADIGADSLAIVPPTTLGVLAALRGSQTSFSLTPARDCLT